MAESTGLSRDTVLAGLREIQGRREPVQRAEGLRLRRSGGGRKSLRERDPVLRVALERKLDPVTRLAGGLHGLHLGRVELPLPCHCCTDTSFGRFTGILIQEQRDIVPAAL